jgi:hypothetical protein
MGKILVLQLKEDVEYKQMSKNRANFACVLNSLLSEVIMTKKFLVLASFLGLNLLIAACQPTTQTPTNTPAGTTPTPTTPPATTPPPAVPPAATPTPAVPPATTPAPGATP